MVTANILTNKSGLSNYMGCKIPLPSKFNFEFLEFWLQDYNDKQVIQFLKYGFPLGHNGLTGSQEKTKNHTGARNFPQQIAKLLEKEVKLKVAIGPFNKPVLKNTCFSPLNSVPKKDSQERCLILDLSMPRGNSINDEIEKDWYLGEYDKMTLPSIDDLVERIMKLKVENKAVKVFKVDLRRAYRQIFTCPKDINLLAYMFDGAIFYDCTLSMGSRSSTRCCQRVSSAVVFIYGKFGYFAINYLDDIGSCEEEGRAEEAYSRLRQLLTDFGLTEAAEKSVPPSWVMVV